MSVKTLSNDELLALVGLVKMVVRADQALSEEESKMLRALSDEVGTEAFTAAVTEATQKFTTRAEVMVAARAVTSPEARSVIYGKLLDFAGSDEVVVQEERILSRIREIWGIPA